jgi:hypothetical protein
MLLPNVSHIILDAVSMFCCSPLQEDRMGQGRINFSNNEPKATDGSGM